MKSPESRPGACAPWSSRRARTAGCTIFCVGAQPPGPDYDRRMAGSARVMPRQDVRLCRSADGVTIAYAVHGSGPPLVIDGCWLSHLQYDWESPVWRHFLIELGKIATVIRFDERGHGLSDRDVTDHSLELRLADLEAVVYH